MAGSYGLRPLLWSVAALLAAMGIIYLVHARALERHALEEASQRAGTTLRAVEWLVRTSAPTADMGDFDQWVIGLGGQLDTRITYISGGKVLAESHVDPARLPGLENHADRPEILRALETGHGQEVRFSATLNRRMIYSAMRVSGITGLPDGVLRVATPALEVEARMTEAKRQAVPLLLSVFFASAGLIWMATRSMSRTVESFSHSVARIGQGQYDERIRLYPGAEFRPLAQAINAMAQDIRSHMQAVAEHKSQREAVFEGLAEGVAVVGTGGRILDANPALGKLLCCPAPVGATLLEACLNIELQGAVADALAQADNPAPRRVELNLRGGRMAEAVLVPFGQNGERRLIVVVRDTSEARRSELAMRGFLINAAHWLRTPLASVQGYIETAMDAGPQTDARAMLGVALRGAREMALMVQGMLALAKTRASAAGHDDVRAVACAGAALDQAVEAMALTLEGKGLRLDVSRPAGQLEAQGDCDALVFVFQALLAKAASAAPAGGGVRLAVMARKGYVDVAASWGENPADPGLVEPAEGATELLANGDLPLAMSRELLAAYGGSLALQAACGAQGQAGAGSCAALVRLKAVAQSSTTTAGSGSAAT